MSQKEQHIDSKLSYDAIKVDQRKNFYNYMCVAHGKVGGLVTTQFNEGEKWYSIKKCWNKMQLLTSF